MAGLQPGQPAPLSPPACQASCTGLAVLTRATDGTAGAKKLDPRVFEALLADAVAYFKTGEMDEARWSAASVEGLAVRTRAANL
jgi:hypothetical protein